MRWQKRTWEGNGKQLTCLEWPDVGTDEVIIKMESKTNDVLIDQLTFTIKNTKGETRTVGPFGKTDKNPFSISATNGI